jgi:hypothetical protein
MKIVDNKSKSAVTVFFKTVIITAAAILLIAIGYFAAAYFSGTIR